MKVSEIEPTAWEFAMKRNPRMPILLRKWKGIQKKVRQMDGVLLELMQNPHTTAEQLSIAAKLYASVAKELHDHAVVIDTYLYHGHKLTHMVSCPTYKSGIEAHCECKDWQEQT